MKNKILFSLIISFTLSSFTIGAQNGKPFKCTIKGKVVDRPESKLLYLVKRGEDARVNRIEIPIANSVFEYELTATYEEMYELEFVDERESGAWRPVNFMAEPGLVEMTLYPSERYDDNVIKGGPQNQIYLNYREKVKSLFDFRSLEKRRDELPNQGLTDEAFAIIQKAKQEENKQVEDSLYSHFKALMKTKKAFTDEYLDIERNFKKLFSEFNEWENTYIKDNVSISSYSILIAKATRADKDIFPKYMDIANTIYIPKYPNHPYTEEIDKIARSFSDIRIGGKYIDFTLPDFDGNNVTLSEQIAGKVAVIDLWASWCGPCRRLSRSMIPIYEEYKDKGFTILGVAREDKRENGVSVAQKDKHPWVNLLELKDAGGIWKLYGISNSGGSTFLVDRDGTILAIHPTADEVKKILSEKLK